jgi:hypothetical protein
LAWELVRAVARASQDGSERIWSAYAGMAWRTVVSWSRVIVGGWAPADMGAGRGAAAWS